jgi:hypothetical protein
MTTFCDAHPTARAMSITPGQDAVYALGRTLDDQDGRRPPVIVQAATADICRCLTCWIEAFKGQERVAA